MSRRIATRNSPIHGKGVFAVAELPAGEVLIEYKGRRITHAQADRRYGDDGESGHTFLFTLNDRYVIDANEGGNAARWMNHGCSPNCEAVIEEDPDGDLRKDRVLIQTIRRVQPGEELVYDYGITLAERHTPRLKKIWACRCGARNCSGTMLRPKRAKAAS